MYIIGKKIFQKEMSVICRSFIILIALLMQTYTVLSSNPSATSEFGRIKELAEEGDVNAQFRLGDYYYNGCYTPTDYEKAFEWFKRASEGGHIEAMYTVGMMYLEGEIVQQDSNKALKWLKKAAEAGYLDAQYNLGVIYNKDKYDVPADSDKAIKWYIICGEQGHLEALLNLGRIYATGQGVEKDYIKAYVWWSIAADYTDERAKHNLDVLIDMMSPDQISSAKEETIRVKALIKEKYPPIKREPLIKPKNHDISVENNKQK